MRRWNTLRFTNEADGDDVAACAPAYNTFNAFHPDWDALATTEMFAHFMSRGDCELLLEAVNDELAFHRTRQKLSSLMVVFGTLLAVILAVFEVFAGVGLQMVVLLVHVVLTRWLRERCTGRIRAFLVDDVNPAIDPRGVAVDIVEVGEGWCSNVSYTLELSKKPHYDAVRRERALQAGQSIQAIDEHELHDVDVGVEAAALGSRQPTTVASDDFSGVVVGMPLADGEQPRADAGCLGPVRRPVGR